MMLIHSCIYYKMHTTVIPDDMWQRLANELRDIQENDPKDIGWYDREFDGWTGDTGMHLPSDGWVLNKSAFVVHIHKTMKVEEKEEDIFYY